MSVDSAPGASVPWQGWVESPLQLINAIEHAHAHECASVIHLRTTAPQMQATATLLSPFLPPEVTLHPATSVRTTPAFGSAPRRVIGDLYSGQVRASLASSRWRKLALVDDGSAMLAMAQQLVDREALRRPAVNEGRPMRWLSSRLRRTLDKAIVKGKVEIFTAYANRQVFSSLAERGARVSRNSYAWTRSLDLEELPELAPTVIVGSALAHDGHIDPTAYFNWIESLTGTGEVSYLPHRREDATSLKQMAALPGVTVVKAGLPVEAVLGAASSSEPRRVVTLPSSVVVTLGALLPPDVNLDVVNVPEPWWTDTASQRFRTTINSIDQREGEQ